MPSARRDTDDANVLFLRALQTLDAQEFPDFRPGGGGYQLPCCLPFDFLPRLRLRFLRFSPVCGGLSPLLSAGVCAWGVPCGASATWVLAVVVGSSGVSGVCWDSFSVMLSPSRAPHPGSSISAVARGLGSGLSSGLSSGLGSAFCVGRGFVLRGGLVDCLSAVGGACCLGVAGRPGSPLRGGRGALGSGVGGAWGGSTLRSIISSLANTPRVPSGNCTWTSCVRICVPVTLPIWSFVLTQIFLCGRHFFRSR